MAKALAELDALTSNLAQNKVNNIIFQAHAGLLTQEMQTSRITVFNPRDYFQPVMQPGMSTSPQPPIYGENGQSQFNPAGTWQT